MNIFKHLVYEFYFDSILIINHFLFNDSRIYVNKHETRDKQEEMLIYDTNTSKVKTHLYLHNF